MFVFNLVFFVHLTAAENTFTLLHRSKHLLLTRVPDLYGRGSPALSTYANLDGSIIHNTQANLTFDASIGADLGPEARPYVALRRPRGLREIVSPIRHLQQDPTLLAPYRFPPNCFPGDDRLHALRIGITADTGFFQKGGSNAEIEFAVAVASAIYRGQLNVRLEIAEIRTKDNASAPLFNLGTTNTPCPKTLSAVLDLAASTHANLTSKNALWHHMTACLSMDGALGMAYVGTTCQKRFNSGVTSRTPTAWRTFVHELGHGLGATHSFELGMGQTGGIMDYGKGFIKNTTVYGFDARKRPQVCNMLNRSSCLTLAPNGPPRCGDRIVQAKEQCECLDGKTRCTGCIACKLVNKNQQCSTKTFVLSSSYLSDPQCCKAEKNLSLAGTPCNGGVCSLGRCINPCSSVGYTMCGLGTSGCRVQCKNPADGVCSAYYWAADHFVGNLDDGAPCATGKVCKAGICV